MWKWKDATEVEGIEVSLCYFSKNLYVEANNKFREINRTVMVVIWGWEGVCL